MTEEEITAVLDKAHTCVESECAVTDVDDLIMELKDQQKVLNTRLETIMNVVAHLQHANEQEKRKTDDVRAIVKDMLRVFTTQVSVLLGGDVLLRFVDFIPDVAVSLPLLSISRSRRMANSPWASAGTSAMALPRPTTLFPPSRGRPPPLR